MHDVPPAYPELLATVKGLRASALRLKRSFNDLREERVRISLRIAQDPHDREAQLALARALRVEARYLTVVLKGTSELRQRLAQDDLSGDEYFTNGDAHLKRAARALQDSIENLLQNLTADVLSAVNVRLDAAAMLERGGSLTHDDLEGMRSHEFRRAWDLSTRMSKVCGAASMLRLRILLEELPKVFESIREALR